MVVQISFWYSAVATLTLLFLAEQSFTVTASKPLVLHTAEATAEPQRRSLLNQLLPPAEQSSYASVGKIEPFVGAVDTFDALKEALKNCSYKNEIILIPSTENSMDAAAQTMWMFM